MLNAKYPGFSGFEWKGFSSQDVVFYVRAKELGVRVGVDRDNAIGHVGEKLWTMGDFYEWQESKLKEADGG